MTAEEAKKVEVDGECAAEPSPPPADEVEAPPCEEEKIALVPIEPPVTEEKFADDAKALAVVEKPAEPCEDKKGKGSVNRDTVLARVETDKKDALIKAWEESEKSKAENKAQHKLSAIGAWENIKKAELEAEMKKMEEHFEKKKAKYVEKMKNKLALVHKAAEEKRAITEARRGEHLLKAEEVAAKCRATGATPKKLLGWFSS